jgi:hypothetical protein
MMVSKGAWIIQLEGFGSEYKLNERSYHSLVVNYLSVRLPIIWTDISCETFVTACLIDISRNAKNSTEQSKLSTTGLCDGFRKRVGLYVRSLITWNYTGVGYC